MLNIFISSLLVQQALAGVCTEKPSYVTWDPPSTGQAPYNCPLGTMCLADLDGVDKCYSISFPCPARPSNVLESWATGGSYVPGSPSDSCPYGQPCYFSDGINQCFALPADCPAKPAAVTWAPGVTKPPLTLSYPKVCPDGTVCYSQNGFDECFSDVAPCPDPPASYIRPSSVAVNGACDSGYSCYWIDGLNQCSQDFATPKPSVCPPLPSSITWGAPWELDSLTPNCPPGTTCYASSSYDYYYGYDGGSTDHCYSIDLPCDARPANVDEETNTGLAVNRECAAGETCYNADGINKCYPPTTNCPLLPPTIQPTEALNTAPCTTGQTCYFSGGTNQCFTERPPESCSTCTLARLPFSTPDAYSVLPSSDVLGTDSDGCLTRTYTCNSITPGFQVVVEYNKGNSGMHAGEGSYTETLNCNALGMWVLKPYNTMIRNIACYTF